jgi:hypothetical protein
LSKYGEFGIGLRLGTKLACGGTLVVFDVDDEGFLPLFRTIFGSSACGRVGARGAAFFARATTPIKTCKLKTHAGALAVDVLGDKSFCVLPPTIHPTTGRPYTWLGRPLHDFELSLLPLVEDVR